MRERGVMVLLSGENPRLAFLELTGIIEAEALGGRPRLLAPQVALFSARDPDEAARVISGRAALARLTCLYLGSSRGTLESLRSLLSEVEWPPLTGSFAVRSIRIRGSLRGLTRGVVSATMAEHLLASNPRLSVDLERPDAIVVAVMSGGEIHLGLLLCEVDRPSFRARAPHARPFRHPASMDPRLARAMVNLARVRRGDLVLDPFLGAGGIAIEAALVGARLLGCDVDPAMVRGAEANLRHYGLSGRYTLWVCDAADLRLDVEVDAVVTDPPYGRSAAARGGSRELLLRFASRAPDLLKPGGRLVLAYPAEARPESVLSRHLEVLEVVDHREHKSLTRRIVVARRRGDPH